MKVKNDHRIKFSNSGIFFGLFLTNSNDGYIEMMQIITHQPNEGDTDMDPILCSF